MVWLKLLIVVISTLFSINLRGISELVKTAMSKHGAVYIYLVAGNSCEMEILLWCNYNFHSSTIGTILKGIVKNNKSKTTYRFQ